MGYFSNGTEGEIYEDKYCSNCVHCPELFGKECPVLEAHLEFNYESNAEDILNIFIPRKGIYNDKCKMFFEKQTLKGSL